MKILRRMKKCSIFLVCLLLIFSMFPVSALAETPIDTSREVSLTIDNLCCSRVDYTVYKVADVSTGGRITWTSEISSILSKNENPISTFQKTQEDWSLAASTLAVYVAEDQASEGDKLLTQITGVKSGSREVFSGLDTGIYLVTAGDHTSGRSRHTITPFLITLPRGNAADGGWTYNVTVNPKFSSSSTGGGDPSEDKVTRSVLKTWNDDGDSVGSRPSSITVQLLRDGEEYGDPVTISADNNWRHSFGTLDSGYTWQVTEVDIPSGYDMTVTLRGTTFVMTNSYDPNGTTEIEDPSTPLGPPPEFPPEPPEEIVEIDENGVPLANLPQTGALWWPIVPLLLAGTFLFVLGLVKNRRYGEEDE